MHENTVELRISFITFPQNIIRQWSERDDSILGMLHHYNTKLFITGYDRYG